VSEALWYARIKDDDSSLEQGDIIEKCKVLIPEENGYLALLDEQNSEEIQDMQYIEGDFIIMSQSCDLANDKIDSVIVCPVIPLKKVAEISPELQLKSSKQREVLRQGNIPSYHLLNKIKLETVSVADFYCVSFKHIYSVPKKYLKKLLEGKNRCRLLSPYKEHLSQSFARYFMRVGLPTDISKDEMKNYAIQ